MFLVNKICFFATSFTIHIVSLLCIFFYSKFSYIYSVNSFNENNFNSLLTLKNQSDFTQHIRKITEIREYIENYKQLLPLPIFKFIHNNTNLNTLNTHIQILEETSTIVKILIAKDYNNLQSSSIFTFKADPNSNYGLLKLLDILKLNLENIILVYNKNVLLKQEKENIEESILGVGKQFNLLKKDLYELLGIDKEYRDSSDFTFYNLGVLKDLPLSYLIPDNLSSYSELKNALETINSSNINKTAEEFDEHLSRIRRSSAEIKTELSQLFTQQQQIISNISDLDDNLYHLTDKSFELYSNTLSKLNLN